MPRDAGAPPVRRQQENTNTDVTVWMADVRQGLEKPDRMDTLMDMLGGQTESEKRARVERFIAVALHAINSNATALANCTPMSLVEAVRESASLGLEPTGLLGEAWILPYGRTARLQVGYRGYLKLIRNSGQVAGVDCQLVYVNDAFDVALGTASAIVHKPLLEGDRGGYRGAYAWARLKTGELIIEWMTVNDIEQVRAASPAVKANRSSPWDDWWGEMARKSVVRRLIKRLPLSPQAQRAEMVDNEAEEAIQLPAHVKPSARSAALAALPGGEPDAEDPEAASEPTGEPEAGEPTEAPPIEIFDPEPSEGPVCGSVSPYGDDQKCIRKPDHEGNHQSADRASWQ